jgi:hypothetical protein
MGGMVMKYGMIQSTQDSVDNINKILTEMNADHPGDIIADILHWCDKHNQDFDDLVLTGKDYYEEEKKVDTVNS